jgi:hypothetical protein
MTIMHARGKRPAESALIAAALIVGLAAKAQATTDMHYGLAISSSPTKNVTFANGVFMATGTNATLNVNHLAKALAKGDVEVTTGDGSGGGPNAGDIHVNAGFTWTSKYALTLDAWRSIHVAAAVVDAGKGGLTLTTNDGGTTGTFIYSAGGSIAIWDIDDRLIINGQHYLLDSSVQSLAGDIEANPAGYFALANSYDASKDGPYTGSPIATEFTGAFEGLGNTISNLTINSGVGLFNVATGTLSDVNLANVAVTGPAAVVPVGALVGTGNTVEGATSSGSVTISNDTNTAAIGGLIGQANKVINCSSTATVQSQNKGYVGGLIGSSASISNSFAAGAVSGPGGATVGGLTGTLNGGSAIVDSYASGTVKITGLNETSYVGGLVGSVTSGTITGSFATGAVSGTGGSSAGGLTGVLSGGSTIAGSYATGTVKATSTGSSLGGLVGSVASGAISGSFANGNVSGPRGVSAGGLIGIVDQGTITDSYATGNVTASVRAKVGGLIGEWPNSKSGTVATSYATGAPNAEDNSWIGGLLGLDNAKGGCRCFNDTDWDTTTSGITNLSQGAGFPANEPGITGLTTTQFQSGLPAGFDPTVWAESASINNGLPYLIANPPPQ